MKSFVISIVVVLLSTTAWSENALVLQSDFGNKDAAVASMKGVAVGVSADLDIYDLTHEIPVFNIWEASLRLVQTAEYWPAGTVFVSVVDPGVGTARKSVVLKTKSGHYFVTPDNGTLTFAAIELGVAEVREIDEAVNRLKNSEKSYTFHGRDVYAYTGARLAAGVISFEQVGRSLPAEVIMIPFQEARFADGTVSGNIPILDIQFGNVWTNIDRETFRRLGAKPGDTIKVKITHGDDTVLQSSFPYVRSFGAVAKGNPLVYLNSLTNVSLAINQGSFAEKLRIESGAEWNIFLSVSE
jgi:S-adenosylmethionine hydrolase